MDSLDVFIKRWDNVDRVDIVSSREENAADLLSIIAIRSLR